MLLAYLLFLSLVGYYFFDIRTRKKVMYKKKKKAIIMPLLRIAAIWLSKEVKHFNRKRHKFAYLENSWRRFSVPVFDIPNMF